jgi:hypothetical protein
MRMAVAATTLGLTLLAAGALAACSPDGPAQTPGPEPSRTPVFASEEEALAAAEELYGKYEEVTDTIAQSGWSNLDGLDEVLRGDALTAERDAVRDLEGKGLRQVGRSSFDSVTLQRFSDHGKGTVELVIYLCGDVSGVDVLDEDGNSVVSPERPDRQPFEVTIDDLDGVLKISGREAWIGANFC